MKYLLLILFFASCAVSRPTVNQPTEPTFEQWLADAFLIAADSGYVDLNHDEAQKYYEKGITPCDYVKQLMCEQQ